MNDILKLIATIHDREKRLDTINATVFITYTYCTPIIKVRISDLSQDMKNNIQITNNGKSILSLVNLINLQKPATDEHPLTKTRILQFIIYLIKDNKLELTERLNEFINTDETMKKMYAMPKYYPFTKKIYYEIVK